METMPPDVDAALQAFPSEVRCRLAEVRALILTIAAGDARIGPLTETLKWGEPAYLTKATGSGSTIRLGSPRNRPDRAAIYFICSTTLVETFRERFGAMFEYESNRAVLLPAKGDMDRAPIESMLSMALTYHLR